MKLTFDLGVDKNGHYNLQNTIDTVRNAISAIGQFNNVKIDWSGNQQGNEIERITATITDSIGVTEKYTYSLKELGQTFAYVGHSGSDNGVEKQTQSINKAFSDYTQKLAQFKSTNSEILTGLTKPLNDFELKLNGLKNGTVTIEQVATAFKTLQTFASEITTNFNKQLSPIDSAIRNLSKGKDTIASLKAEFQGLSNAPKNINTELNKCSA